MFHVALWTMQALRSVREFKECNGHASVDLRLLENRLRQDGFEVHVVETNHNLGSRPISKGCLEQLRHTYIICEGYNGRVCSRWFIRAAVQDVRSCMHFVGCLPTRGLSFTVVGVVGRGLLVWLLGRY